MIQAIISQAFRLLIGQVFDQVSDRVPIPQEFWNRVADLSSRLASEMVVNGGQVSDKTLVPYYQELHRLMRQFNLIEKV